MTTTITQPTARLPGTGPDIMLPVEFRAFHALHHHAYLAYATAHTPTGADNLIRDAFGTLAVNWAILLRSPNPTAAAWDHVARHTPHLLLHTISPLHFQLTVLHHLVGLSAITAADTTGCDPPPPPEPSSARHSAHRL
ncbi:hypothetical protein ACFRR7_35315 [Streptomyces sp. NPDC056909]|uniref:hypothetical protein n=1 Tax=Streptomyces sp. NPDC056909 TaxID=3345963 RepID=UPI0036B88901